MRPFNLSAFGESSTDTKKIPNILERKRDEDEEEDEDEKEEEEKEEEEEDIW